MGAGSSGKGRICLRSSGGCMMGGCRSRGRGPARLKLPRDQRKHYVGQEGCSSGAQPKPGSPPSQLGAHTQKCDPHHTHFPCRLAPEQWSTVPCGPGGGRRPVVLPFWVIFTSPFSSLPPPRPLGILQTQENHRPSLQAACWTTRSPMPLATPFFWFCFPPGNPNG